MLIRGAHIWTGSVLLHDAAVLIEEGTIREVGSWKELRARHPSAPVCGGKHSIILPGLINAHHHGQGITSFQAGAKDQCLEPWLASLRDTPAVDPFLDTLWAAIGLLGAGYSTVVLFQSTLNVDKAVDEANALIRACRAAGLRVALGLDLMQINTVVYGAELDGWPPRQGLATETYLSVLEQLRQRWADDDKVAVFPAPSGVQWVTDEAWQAIGAWSREHDTPLHTHCLESPYEAAYAKRAYGGDSVGYLDRMGALHRRTSLVHGVYLSESELEQMAASGASLITNPGSNLRLRCGVSPVLSALAKGVVVALGTDGMTLGDADDALAEIRLLHHLQRTPGIDTPALAWEQSFAAATASAAVVTPWAERVGRIAPGMVADLTLYDYEEVVGPWVHPRVHPLEVLLHRGAARHLEAVMVDGKWVWTREDGTTHVSAAAVREQFREHIESSDRPTPSGLTARVEDYYRSWAI